jgi:hypothetical protein
MSYTREQITDATGFDNGEKFNSEEEVYDYFSPEVQVEMFGTDAVINEVVLDVMARTVIRNRWHMRGGV